MRQNQRRQTTGWIVQPARNLSRLVLRCSRRTSD